MKTRAICDWARFFGVEILDNDGFPSFEMQSPVTLVEFLKGINECTIDIENEERYAILAFLI
jgi:hypothetical protein